MGNSIGLEGVVIDINDCLGRIGRINIIKYNNIGLIENLKFIYVMYGLMKNLKLMCVEE